MLELTDAVKTISLPAGGNLQVLRGVSLRIAAGESVAVLGRSGSGKSTLLGLLGLIDTLSSGSYAVDGVETVGLGDKAAARLRGAMFGFVYQRFCLMSQFSAFRNVEAPLLHAPVNRARRREAVFDALDKVGLAERARHKPDQLSGGEQQRVSIARALVHKPRVILADEPTGSLDVATGAAVLDLMLDLVREAGVTLVVVTHDPQIAARLGRTVEVTDGVSLERAW